MAYYINAKYFCGNWPSSVLIAVLLSIMTADDCLSVIIASFIVFTAWYFQRRATLVILKTNFKSQHNVKSTVTSQINRITLWTVVQKWRQLCLQKGWELIISHLEIFLPWGQINNIKQCFLLYKWNMWWGILLIM